MEQQEQSQQNLRYISTLLSEIKRQDSEDIFLEFYNKTRNWQNICNELILSKYTGHFEKLFSNEKLLDLYPYSLLISLEESKKGSKISYIFISVILVC